MSGCQPAVHRMVDDCDREPQPAVLTNPGADDSLEDEKRHLGVIGDQADTFSLAELGWKVTPVKNSTGAPKPSPTAPPSRQPRTREAYRSICAGLHPPRPRTLPIRTHFGPISSPCPTCHTLLPF